MSRTYKTIGGLAALALALAGCVDGADDGDDNGLTPDGGLPADAGGVDAAPGAPADGCAPLEAYFAEHIWAGFMSSACVGCHIEGGAADGSRLHLQSRLSDGGLQANIEALRTLAVEVVDGPGGNGLRLLVAKPTGQHPDSHGGGALLRPDSEEAMALAWFAERLAAEDDPCVDGGPGPLAGQDCAAPTPGPRVLRRLSHVEYRNTIAALLGEEAGATADGALSADEVVDGFDNHAGALVAGDLLVDQYRLLAESLAEGIDLAGLVPCDPAAGGANCARSFIVDFGLRAFRRPLTATEIDRYLSIYDLVAADDGFEAGVRWLMVAFLQSPHFLYRTELGKRGPDGFRLTAYEIATQLAYLVWQGPPDETLLDLAARGLLYDPAVVDGELERMLADPRSEGTLRHFAWRWLGLDRLDSVTRDPAIYPELTADIRRAMAGQTARFLGERWRDGDTIGDLLRVQDEHLTDGLAAYYGLPPSDAPADPEGFRRHQLGDSPYGGLLTQGALLTTHALPTTSSPIHRGLLVRERLLCQHLPPPPVNLDISPPPVDPELSTRARYAQHSDDPACAGCHALIDPIGFAFEHFDGIGRWRPDDGAHAIDASGEIIGSATTDGAFDGVDELAVLLADSPEIEACYAEQWLRFGFGGTDDLPTECYVERVTHDIAAGDGALAAVVPAITRLPRFTARLGGDDELDVPGGDLLPGPDEVPEGGIEPPDIEAPPPDPEPDPGPVGEIAFELVEQSRWAQGYCADGVVRNPGPEAVVWSVTIEVEGTINNIWNAQRSADNGRVTFTGDDWNAEVAPGGEARFGFCAEL